MLPPNKVSACGTPRVRADRPIERPGGPAWPLSGSTSWPSAPPPPSPRPAPALYAYGDMPTFNVIREGRTAKKVPVISV